MNNRIIAFIFAATALSVPALAQTAQLHAPSDLEKELAARASNVDEITLDKKMLSFASQFMNHKQTINPLANQDADATRKLIESLDGIYVRDYEFDKEGQFTAEQAEQLRAYYETNEWSPMVRDRDRKTGESSDIMVKLVNGESHGLLILDIEPKEISIVLIMGPVHMQDLHKVMGIAVRGSLTGGSLTGQGGMGDVSRQKVAQAREKEALAKEKEALAKQQESLAKAREALAKQKEAQAREKEALAKEKEALAKQQESLAKAREALAKQKGAQAKEKTISEKSPDSNQ